MAVVLRFERYSQAGKMVYYRNAGQKYAYLPVCKNQGVFFAMEAPLIECSLALV